MTHLNGYHKNGSHRNHTFKPRLVKGPVIDQAAAYEAALELVNYIDYSLTTGTQHYRTKTGLLLRTLDEVVHAILADNLLLDGEALSWDQDLARAA